MPIFFFNQRAFIFYLYNSWVKKGKSGSWLGDRCHFLLQEAFLEFNKNSHNPNKNLVGLNFFKGGSMYFSRFQAMQKRWIESEVKWSISPLSDGVQMRLMQTLAPLGVHHEKWVTGVQTWAALARWQYWLIQDLEGIQKLETGRCGLNFKKSPLFKNQRSYAFEQARDLLYLFQQCVRFEDLEARLYCQDWSAQQVAEVRMCLKAWESNVHWMQALRMFLQEQHERHRQESSSGWRVWLKKWGLWRSSPSQEEDISQGWKESFKKLTQVVDASVIGVGRQSEVKKKKVCVLALVPRRSEVLEKDKRRDGK